MILKDAFPKTLDWREKVRISGEFKIYPILYDNWLFFTLFLFSPKKKSEEEKKNEVANPVLNHFFLG